MASISIERMKKPQPKRADNSVTASGVIEIPVQSSISHR